MFVVSLEQSVEVRNRAEGDGRKIKSEVNLQPLSEVLRLKIRTPKKDQTKSLCNVYAPLCSF